MWRFWPTDADPRDAYANVNYADVAEEDGNDDGHGPDAVGAAGDAVDDEGRGSDSDYDMEDVEPAARRTTPPPIPAHRARAYADRAQQAAARLEFESDDDDDEYGTPPSTTLTNSLISLIY